MSFPGKVVSFIDIGTNGELVLAVDGRLTASATAAGPASSGSSAQGPSSSPLHPIHMARFQSTSWPS